MIFRLRPLRFSFVAVEPIEFGEGSSANTLRGAFGTIFRRIVCSPMCSGAAGCERRASCPYARMFEPSATILGPSGLANWPRPFVFRATHLDGRVFPTGHYFHFDLNLFDTETLAIGYLLQTFAQLAHEGLGPNRRRVELTSVVQLNEASEPAATVYDNTSIPPLELDLTALDEPVSRISVEFLTPTELKGEHQIMAQPEFGVLAGRMRDRISTLSKLYGEGGLDLDFRAYGERASQVRMTHYDIRHVDLIRRSSRTGRVHPIGGFVGEADYEGDLREFLPYLKVAQWTGVGRQTVWGKGQLALRTSNLSNTQCG